LFGIPTDIIISKEKKKKKKVHLSLVEDFKKQVYDEKYDL
jgi:hypothetical protein